jgi:hypothetical protein
MRSISTLLLGCFLASGLSACSGGNSATSVVPAAQHGNTSQQPSSPVRSPRSGGSCTPDSYGYCLVITGGSATNKVWCDGGLFHFATITQNNQLYYNGVAQGQYVKTTTNYSCDGSDPTISWSPQDPADATGDPNLP